MKTIEDIVNDSGYPLQIHLEKLIDETYGISHRWRVAVSEHRWVNGNTGEEGFIDLILEHQQFNLKLVIECKRISGNWIFLLPTMIPRTVYKARLLHANFGVTNFLWTEANIEPQSWEAAYCVLETDGKKDNRTLEKLTADLLLSLEFLAIEEAALNKPIDIQQSPITTHIRRDVMFYIPIIVTTARLHQMSFDPSNIEIKDGKIIDGTSKTSPIEFIRFRKNLATNIKYDSLPYIGE